MAASSQYHRGAAAPPSHYHALSNDHEHLYTGLATSWNSSHGPLSRAPAGSALLQRFSPSAHRPPAHYVDYSGPSDYVGSNPQQQWPPAYNRSASQAWSPNVNENSFASRSLSYSEADDRSPAPQANTHSQPSRQHDNTDPSQGAHHEHHAATVSTGIYRHRRALTSCENAVMASNAPAFPVDAPTLAPLLNYANPNMHVSPTHVLPHVAATWAPAPNTEISSVAPQHAFSHPVDALPSDVALGGPGPLPGSAWSMPSSGPDNATAVVYEQLPETTQLWPVEPDPHQFGHMHSILPNPVPHGTTVTRGRRAQPKKTAAKVPAAFVARQQKSKVSKRRGPLDEQGRQKTHNMRKLKMSCLRCRFYKSGVGADLARLLLLTNAH